MKHEINYGNSVMVIPKDTVLNKLPAAGETELKFLLHFMAKPELQDDYEANADSLAAEMGVKRSELDSALAFWRGAEVLTASATETQKKQRKVQRHSSAPAYSGEEISKIIDENGLDAVIDECQRMLGKIFNITEVNRIASLNSYLGLSSEFILLLFTYCAEHDKLSLKYIEKTAYDLYDKGIDSIDKLEDHIKVEEERRSLTVKLRTLFGWGERALTPSEKKHITQWLNEFNYEYDIICEAYNITVEKTGKPALAYMSKILLNWHTQGYKTLEDVQNALSAYEKAKNEEKKQDSKDSFDVDEFFELALKRSREKMSKYTGEQDGLQ